MKRNNPPARLFKWALIVTLLPALAGCVVVLAPPLSWVGHDKSLHETTVQGSGHAKILLLPIAGFISDKPSEKAFGLVEKQSTLTRVVAQLRKAAQDPAVKAVVLRIDSPGGGVTASDEIYQRIHDFAHKQHIPVIASMGALAASGAYYVSCSADTIVAEPTTVTGSIGVVLVGVNISGLMAKIGVKNQTLTSAPHKDELSPLRPITPADRAIVQRIVDHLFDRFVQVVKDNRPHLHLAKIKTITDGRVFDATDAMQLGLVDRIGRLDDAIELARQRAGVPKARVIRYHRAGAAPKTIYSAAAGLRPGAGPAQINLLPIDLSAIASTRFLYLWRPGLHDGG